MGNKKKGKCKSRRDRKCDCDCNCRCTNCTYPKVPIKKPTPTQFPSVVTTEYPSVVIVESPSVVITESPSVVIAEYPSVVIAEYPSVVIAEYPSVVIAESPSVIIAESPSVVTIDSSSTITTESTSTVTIDSSSAVTTNSSSIVTTNSYVYLNQNVTQNGVSAWLISPANSITWIDTYTTGGTGGTFLNTGSKGLAIVGTNLYAANTVSNDISGFTIDPTTGRLTSMAGSPFATGGISGYGMSLAASPNGKFLYVSNQQSNNISVFSIDPVSGVLTLTSTFANPYGTQLMQLQVSPNNNFLLATIYDIKKLASYSINQLNGQLTAIGSINIVSKNQGSPVGIDITANSNFVYVAIAEKSPPADSLIIDIFSLNANGILVGLSNYIENIGIRGQGQSRFVKLSNDNKYLFVDSSANNSITSLLINPNGSLTKISTSTVPGYNLTQMVINNAGTLLYNLDNANGFYFSTIASNGMTMFANSVSFGGYYAPPIGIAIYN